MNFSPFNDFSEYQRICLTSAIADISAVSLL
jgi:hypothetical protein